MKNNISNIIICKNVNMFNKCIEHIKLLSLSNYAIFAIGDKKEYINIAENIPEYCLFLPGSLSESENLQIGIRAAFILSKQDNLILSTSDNLPSQSTLDKISEMVEKNGRYTLNNCEGINKFSAILHGWSDLFISNHFEVDHNESAEYATIEKSNALYNSVPMPEQIIINLMKEIIPRSYIKLWPDKKINYEQNHKINLFINKILCLSDNSQSTESCVLCAYEDITESILKVKTEILSRNSILIVVSKINELDNFGSIKPYRILSTTTGLFIYFFSQNDMAKP